jgi:hypothetical protein
MTMPEKEQQSRARLIEESMPDMYPEGDDEE